MKLTLTLFVAVLRTASLRVTEAQLEAAIIELLESEGGAPLVRMMSDRL